MLSSSQSGFFNSLSRARNKIICQSTVTGDANKRTCKLCLFLHEKRSLKQTGSAMNIAKEYRSTGCFVDCLPSKAERQCPLYQQTLTMGLSQARPSRQCLFRCFFSIIVIYCSNTWTETEILLDLAYFYLRTPQTASNLFSLILLFLYFLDKQ